MWSRNSLEGVYRKVAQQALLLKIKCSYVLMFFEKAASGH